MNVTLPAYLYSLSERVHANDLVPHQHSTQLNFKRATDFRVCCFIKHPGLSEFHSLSEYLHAGLLEADPTVTAFVPQPFQLTIRGRRYKPDCYVVRGGERLVLEIKPRGEFADDKRLPLEQFFDLNGMKFKVISNESILDRRQEAENWIDIIHTLHQARSIDTKRAELDVIDMFYQAGEEGCRLDEVIEPGDREMTYESEVSVFRLLHRGKIKADLSSCPIDFNTRFTLCHQLGDVA